MLKLTAMGVSWCPSGEDFRLSRLRSGSSLVAAAAAAAAAAAKSFQSCPSLCDPMDGSPPGPAVPGVL